MWERLASPWMGTGTGLATHFHGVGKEIIGHFDGGLYAVSKSERTGGT